MKEETANIEIHACIANPCPLCEAHPSICYIYYDNLNNCKYQVECSNKKKCKRHLRTKIFDTREEAIAEWQTRTENFNHKRELIV